jgi:large subunit ribosomal protein L15
VLNDFKLSKIVKKGKVVGRGGKRGKSAGRGRGGQLSRAGGRSKVGVFFAGGQMPLNRSIPRRGFNSTQDSFSVVNLMDLEDRFEQGATVGLAELRMTGLLRGSKKTRVKVLADGLLSKALHISVNAISKSARLAIEQAGGSVSLL